MKKMKKLDVVYVIKDAAYNKELRYSLRSLKNYPHRKVVFYGGKPVGLKPDRQVVVNQKGETKYDRVHNMLEMIALDDELTEDIVLFNDDFFVLKPQKIFNLCTTYDSLAEYIMRIEIKNGGRPTPYTLRLKETLAQIWNPENFCPANSETHTPMVFNRKQLLEILNKYPGLHGVRSLYTHESTASEDEAIYLRRIFDVKITDLESTPDPEDDFASTSDESFADGKAGRFIREMFPKKCKYER